MNQQRATGEFDVQLALETPEADGAILRVDLARTWRGDLAGIRGRMGLDVDDEGVHHHVFDHTLPQH